MIILFVIIITINIFFSKKKNTFSPLKKYFHVTEVREDLVKCCGKTSGPKKAEFYRKLLSAVSRKDL